MHDRHDNEYDAAIVGYGPVGQMAAILLGQMGHRVGVFERWPEFYPLPRAVVYDDEAGRIFQAAGVIDEVLKISEPVPDIYEWRNQHGETLNRIDWSAQGFSGWTVANFFPLPELQEVLDKRAKSLPTVEINQGWEMQQVSEADDHVELTVRKGRAQAGQWVPEDESRIVRARYVLGAEGANSPIRDHMGVPTTDLGFAFDWLIVDVIPHEKRRWKPYCWQLCDPARPTTVVSGGPGRRRWEFMRLPDESIDELNTEETAWRLLEPWGMHPENAELERHAVYTFRAFWAESWRRNRLFIAGDATHLMPPFAGQGMCSGLRDVMNLAWKLDLVLSGASPEEILDTYESERLSHVRQVIDFSVQLGEIICITDTDKAAERDQRMIAGQEGEDDSSPLPPPVSGIGPGLLYQGDQGSDARSTQGRSPDGEEGLVDETFQAAGRRSVQGRVRYKDKEGLFDNVVGGGWTVLSPVAEPRTVLGEDQLSFLDRLGAHLLKVVQEPAPGDEAAVIDLDGKYAGRFRETDTEAVVIRPDFYVYGTARTIEDLPHLISSLQAALGQSQDRPAASKPSVPSGARREGI